VQPQTYGQRPLFRAPKSHARRPPAALQTLGAALLCSRLLCDCHAPPLRRLLPNDGSRNGKILKTLSYREGVPDGTEQFTTFSSKGKLFNKNTRLSSIKTANILIWGAKASKIGNTNHFGVKSCF
jgi:hypothetical protein